MTSTHTTPFAGFWYPDRRRELEALLDRLFTSSRCRTGPHVLPRPLAFVVPHAGLNYSGIVAASAYRHIQAAQPDRVFILGFTHRGSAPGIWIPDIGTVETPLGEVLIDQAKAAALVAEGTFAFAPERNVCDHSIEIQLPLLQAASPHVRIIPLYVGHLSETQRSAAAQILSRHISPSDILLASSDFTHYGRSFGYEPFPPDDDVKDHLSSLDQRFIDAAGSLESAHFLRTLNQFDATVCGYEPIALLLETLRCIDSDEIFQKTLDYQTSADITGDSSTSVSYASLGYFRTNSFFLDEHDQMALLASARATLRHLSVTGRRRPFPPVNAGPALLRRSAAFVSLHLGEELFGCIGRKADDMPLAEIIPELALSAALDDRRFPQHEEFPEELHIEISLLTPFKRILDWRSFCFSRDGACLEMHNRFSLLLPQVANHAGMTGTRFLEALSLKVGLQNNAYRDPQARLSVFRAQVFGGPLGSA